MRATNDEAASGSVTADTASESAAANARIRLLGGHDQQSSLPTQPGATKALPGVQELLQVSRSPTVVHLGSLAPLLGHDMSACWYQMTDGSLVRASMICAVQPLSTRSAACCYAASCTTSS